MKKSVRFDGNKLRELLKELSYTTIDDLEKDMIVDTLSNRRKKILADKCISKGDGLGVIKGALFSTHDYKDKILALQSVDGVLFVGLVSDERYLFA